MNNSTGFETFINSTQDPNHQLFLSPPHSTWPLPLSSSTQTCAYYGSPRWQQQIHLYQQRKRSNTIAATSTSANIATIPSTVAPLQITDFTFTSNAVSDPNPILADGMRTFSNDFNQKIFASCLAAMRPYDFNTCTRQLQPLLADSSINRTQPDLMESMNMAATTFSMMNTTSMDLTSHATALVAPVPRRMTDYRLELDEPSSSQHQYTAAVRFSANSIMADPPGEQWIESGIFPGEDNGLNTTDPRGGHYSMFEPSNDLTNTSSPNHAHYICIDSNSPDAGLARSADSPKSYEEIRFEMKPTPSNGRKSIVGAKPARLNIKKSPAHSAKKSQVGEKRVGCRRGPLRSDQREKAHQMRKLRVCLRCKFLKKACDKGDPCEGCQSSHSRLWQVPCTRIDIKDITYFMKDWKADYERHVSLGFSISNVKGFSLQERPIYVTHGYGHFLPIMAREVYVQDEKCFRIDWVETLHGLHFETGTAKLSVGTGGISHSMLIDYLDCHIDGGFEQFVDEYFEGTDFVTEILKTIYRFFCREKLPVLRTALRLVIAYNLTLHVIMIKGLPDDECNLGKVEDQQSKFYGKTIGPVMVNFQVKCALGDMWRELQKDVLKELSSLYSSVYSGDKLKNWPTIFMLVAILLIVWELIQFDCNYRVLDQQAVNKFTGEMEGTPVGVIVGLFSALSQKLPAFADWNTQKHHHLLNSKGSVCDVMTEFHTHVTKYESYLKSRSDCIFDRCNFDSLSNKFLSKLVIRDK